MLRANQATDFWAARVYRLIDGMQLESTSVSLVVDSPVRQILRMTTPEIANLLALANAAQSDTPATAIVPGDVVSVNGSPTAVTAATAVFAVSSSKPRKRPRPSREFRRLAEEQRQQLLGRETQECGPGVLLTRTRAVIGAKNAGDPRALAGSLEDLAAAALSWAERTVADMQGTAK